MNRYLGLVTVALILSSCTAPPAAAPPAAPANGSTARPEAGVGVSAPDVIKAGGQVLVPDIRMVGGRPYLWSEDGARLVFQTETGLWEMKPDGSEVQSLAGGPGHRELVGWWDGGVVYLERQPGEIAVGVGRPGRDPQVIATVGTAQQDGPNFQVWHYLSGTRLFLAVDGRAFTRVDLATGQVTDLADQPPAIHRSLFAVSPDHRYLAYKRHDRGDALRILDLDTGTTRPTGQEAHVQALAPWSPAGDRWAVRAAEPGSGLPVVVGANHVEGATHLDVGDVKGNVRHLHPPERLQLVSGPHWSPDGRWLAVAAGIVRGMATGEPADVRATAVWLVNPESGEWWKLGDLGAGYLAGWHPDGRHLLVEVAGDRMEQWRVADGARQTLPHPWNPDGEARLPDGRFLYVNGETVYLQSEGKPPVPLMGGAGYKWAPSGRGDHAAAIVKAEGEAPKLVVVPLPEAPAAAPSRRRSGRAATSLTSGWSRAGCAGSSGKRPPAA